MQQKSAFTFIAGVALGVGLVVVPVVSSEPLAAWVSQNIYDCGIRVAGGVSGGKASGFLIVGHKWGVCMSGGLDIQYNGVNMVFGGVSGTIEEPFLPTSNQTLASRVQTPDAEPVGTTVVTPLSSGAVPVEFQ